MNNVKLDGKVVVITGGNTGIGKETARDLSRRGAAEVVLACRDMGKAEKAANEIEKETGNKVTTLKLDLASLASIRASTEQLKARHPSIHILINNAGVMMCPQWETEDGFEMQFGTNHLGHFLWTLLLLDNIKNAAPSRIVNLSSRAHTRGGMHFDDLMMKKNYSSMGAYSQSKLANILFTKELNRRLEGTGVTCYAVHPGVVQTELGRHLGGFVNFLGNTIGNLMLKTPEMGAQTSVYCATEESVTKNSGCYFSDCAIKEPTEAAKNMEDAKRLWEISEKLVQLKSIDSETKNNE